MSAWQTMQLRHQFNIASGATPASGEPSYWDGEILWVTPEDVTRCPVGYRLADTRRKITSEGHKSCSTMLAPRDSIVLTKRAPIGQLAILDLEATSNQGCFLLTPKYLAESRFFYYLLLSSGEWLQALGRGSTFMELSTDDLKSLPVAVPGLSQQRAIADYLDRETGRVDALVQEKERLLELLAEKRRTLITSAVTRGINPKAPLRDSGIPWLGLIPKHWETERSKWLFKERDERSVTGEEEMLTVSHITGVTPRSEKNVNMFEAETNEGCKLCQPGDLVINTLWAWMGAMGVARVAGMVSPAYNVYTPNERMMPDYVEALVRIPVFAQEAIRYSKGVWSSRLRLYPEGFFEIWLPVPPPDEQQAIVAHIATETAKLDKLRASAEHSMALLKERRAALIAAAVTGKLQIHTG